MTGGGQTNPSAAFRFWIKRHRTTFQERLQMDEYYVSNWSLWMDFFILWKTLWIVISGGGI